MNELIKVNYENERPTISGRELHEFLEVGTQYKDWFPRMVEYGFIEGLDFSSFLSESTGGRPATDHQLTIEMSKEIAMIQRNEKGKQARQYFIQIEKEYNSPEKIMARALQIANRELTNLRLDNQIKDQQIAELQPKATYYDLVLQCNSLLSVTAIAKDYGMSAQRLNQKLHGWGIQYNHGGIWFLYAMYQDKGYTSTKTQNYSKPDGTQGSKVYTYWTQKGRLFLYDLLKKHGIRPLIERELDIA